MATAVHAVQPDRLSSAAPPPVSHVTSLSSGAPKWPAAHVGNTEHAIDPVVVSSQVGRLKPKTGVVRLTQTFAMQESAVPSVPDDGELPDPERLVLHAGGKQANDDDIPSITTDRPQIRATTGEQL